MQKFTQKYTIVCFLEDIGEGYEFASSNWPLHITLADTFSVEATAEDLKSLLDSIASDTEQMQVTATHNEYFGPDHDIKVTIFEKNENIKQLHNNLVEALEKLGVVFNDPQYTKLGYIPHATVRRHAEIMVGETISIDNLTIVDMFPDENPYQRKIVKKVRLE